MLKKISVVCAKATDQHVARSRDILTNFLDQVSHPETRMTIKRTISECRQESTTVYADFLVLQTLISNLLTKSVLFENNK